MDRQRATELVIGRRQEINDTIHRLMLWDESLTLQENAAKCRIHLPNANMMARRYGLRFKLRRIRQPGKALRTNAFLALRNSGWTLEEIAKAFKCSRQNVACCMDFRVKDTIKPLGRPAK